MMSNKIFCINVMITAGLFVLAACGSSSSDGGTTGGTGGSTGATGGAGGSATTTGGGAGTTATGTGGMPPVNDAGRIACGTVNNGCNPNGNNRVCDLANNRCVQCQSNADCAANPNQMGNPFCDTVGMNGAGLPNDTCEQCLTDAQCPAGNVCLMNNCQLNCTTDAQCAAADPMNPVCNTGVTPGQCVQCLTDTQCVGVTDMNGVPRPHCRVPPANNVNTCRACNTTADCQPGQVCSGNGNCNMAPPDGGGGPPPADASAG